MNNDAEQPKTMPVSTRISSDRYRKLRQLAEADRRTTAAFARMMLEDAIDRQPDVRGGTS
jgi:predicted transcriptional regulator